MHNMQNTKRPKVRQTFGGSFLVPIMGNGDSLIDQDLRFGSQNGLTEALQGCYTIYGSQNGLTEALQGCYKLYESQHAHS